MFLSVPREISVFEYEVGSTQVTFYGGEVSSPLDQYVSCKADNITYEGFTVQVDRQISVRRRRLLTNVSHVLRGLVGYIFHLALSSTTLAVRSTQTLSTFFVTHSVRYVSDYEKIVLRSGLPRKELLSLLSN